jgi:acyl-CoA synthetase (AMP-forming)/AMP-acid ligase II
MLGYLKADNPGVLQPPEEGWHDTGDIVSIDRDGFVTIKGRAKRFAKIGGEMISLAAIETLASELWPDALSAVVTQPDPRRGERVVLVTERKHATRAAFQAHARAKGASDLIPGRCNRGRQAAASRLRQTRPHGRRAPRCRATACGRSSRLLTHKSSRISRRTPYVCCLARAHAAAPA